MKDKTTKNNTLAWAWVLDNAALIEGIVKKQGSGSGVDMDDMHSELVVRLVEKWSSYDERLGKPSTWVWWQCRAVKRELVSRRARSQDREVSMPSLSLESMCSDNGIAEARLLVKEIKAIAKSEEWEAATAVALGYKGDELGEKLGCAPFSARRRVARLRKKIAS